VAYLELHAAAGPVPDAVRIRVARGDADPPVVTAAARVAVRDGRWVIARATLPLAGLPPGAYVARAEVLARGAVVGRVARPFTLVGR